MRILMFFILGFLSLSTVAAPTINVKSLPGKIFFIGYRETNEFKGQGAAQQLYVMNANGSDEQRLLPEFSSIWYLTCYPRLRRLSFVSNSDDESRHGQFVLDISEPWQANQLNARLMRALPENFPVRYFTPVDYRSYYPIAFSPDGKFVAGESLQAGLSIADVNTGAVTKVDGQGIWQSAVPVWSPDSSKIVFVADAFGETPSNEAELFIVNRDGSNLRQLTNLPRSYSWWTLLITPTARQPTHKERHNSLAPQWSPDGRWIAFVNFGDLYKIRPDGKDLTLLVKEAAYPTWSPDGKMIAYAAFRPDIPPLTKEEAPDNVGVRSPNIYVSWADGTGETRVTNNRRRFGYFDLNWCPVRLSAAHF